MTFDEIDVVCFFFFFYTRRTSFSSPSPHTFAAVEMRWVLKTRPPGLTDVIAFISPSKWCGVQESKAGDVAYVKEIVNDWPEEEIARILRDYGEEKHWRLLARRICEKRVDNPITTTKELVAAIGRVPGVKGGRSGGIHPATRTFQGIRIAVNDELGAIEDVIPAAIDALAPGGAVRVELV